MKLARQFSQLLLQGDQDRGLWVLVEATDYLVYLVKASVTQIGWGALSRTRPFTVHKINTE